MAIESVTSTTYAPPQPKLKADQAAQAVQAGQSGPANGAREAEGTRRDNETMGSQQSQPVVNAQGQVTGKIINAIA